jgi:predicted DNA repair protein MutK
VAITLGIVSESPLLESGADPLRHRHSGHRGRYGLVGLIVKLDDIGYWLEEKSSVVAKGIGKSLLVLAPWLMKSLSVVGTLAMFLVGAGLWCTVLRRCTMRLNILPRLRGRGGGYSANAVESGAGLYHWWYRGCGGEAG